MTALDQWAEELAAWAIDPEILAAAPESPYSFPPELFRLGHQPAGTPLTRIAAEAVPDGGTVLDVGAGAGASSLPLVPPAAELLVVDSQASMLDELAAQAAERDVVVRRFDGSWPAVAGDVPPADVVVCANVLYNVADLAPFVAALTAHARRRVVCELHSEHPWVPFGPLWQEVHHQPRPSGPTAELAVAALRELGLEPREERFTRAAPAGDHRALHVPFARRRLCLTEDRDDEVAALLARYPPPARESVVLWWDG